MRELLCINPFTYPKFMKTPWTFHLIKWHSTRKIWINDCFNMVKVHFGNILLLDYNFRFNLIVKVGWHELDLTLLEFCEMDIISHPIEFYDLQHRLPMLYIMHWNTMWHHKYYPWFFQCFFSVDYCVYSIVLTINNVVCTLRSMI